MCSAASSGWYTSVSGASPWVARASLNAGSARTKLRRMSARSSASRARPIGVRAGKKPGPSGGMPGVGIIQMLGITSTDGNPSFSTAISAAGMAKSTTTRSAGCASSSASVSAAQRGAGAAKNCRM